MLAALCLALLPIAQGPCVEPDGSLLTPPSAPTPVDVGLYLLDITHIDDVEQSFTADVVLTVRWQDPRLVGSGAIPVCEYPLSSVWSPRPAILNKRSLTESFPPVVRVDQDGWCTYSQRISGDFGFRGNLRDFPFDEQRFTVTVALATRGHKVEATVDEARTNIWEGTSVSNWRLKETSADVNWKLLPHLGEELPLIGFHYDMHRHRGYYIWKVILPLVIVVLMSWAVFWISPKTVLQLGLGATSVLTLIAYRFATATLLPPIGYLTRLDLFLTGCSLLVFAALVEALTTVALGDAGRLEAALKIDRLSRVAFPLAFVLIVLWAFAL